ncbi:MAG: hypothetical protein LBO63_04540 [Oscillospiraceae bacterium]|jgi:hypothetical protein|nr:hypothetical protein [Oscillospiraceae bacterium]
MKKKILIPLLAVVTVTLLLTNCGKGEDPAVSTPPKELKPGIAAENYESLQNDMSYDEIKTILAADSEVLFEADNSAAPDSKWTVYKWTQKEDGPVVYTVLLGDKLSAKAAENLEGASEPEISLIGYARIDTGMTYNEAKSAVGAEGKQSEPYIVNKKESFTYTWENGSVRFSAMFVGDSLFSKELISL